MVKNYLRMLTALLAMTMLFGVNAFAAEVDHTSKVKTDKASWNTGGGPVNMGGISMPEHFQNPPVIETGDVMYQIVKELPNGTYKAVLYATACSTHERDKFTSDVTNGSEAHVYVYANTVQVPVKAKVNTALIAPDEYTLENIEVTDGTLKLGMAKYKNGTNWHTIQIKSLVQIVDNFPAYEAALALANETAGKEMFSSAKAALEAVIAANKDLTASSADDAIIAATTALNNAVKTAEISIKSYEIIKNGFANDVAGWTCTTGNKFQTNTWSNEGNSDGTNMTTPFMENWVAKGSVIGNGSISRSLEGVDNGYYTVTALVRVYSEGGNDITSGITLDVEGTTLDLATAGTAFTYNSMKGIYGEFSATGKVEDGKLSIAFNITDAKFNWVAIKNVKVAYLGSSTPEEGALNVAIETAKAIDVATLNAAASKALTDAITAAEAADRTSAEAMVAATKALNDAIKNAEAIAPALIKVNALIAECEEVAVKSTTADEANRTALTEAIATAKPAVDAAADAAAMTAAMDALEAARQTYVLVAYPTEGCVFDMTFLVKNADMTNGKDNWTTEGTIGTNSGEHWSGVSNLYIEPCDWGATGWTSSFKQTVEVPVGIYKVQVAFRASDGVTADLIANDSTYRFKSIGAVGGTIATDGTEWESVAAGIAAGKTFAKNNEGLGWAYGVIENILIEDSSLTVGGTATTTAHHQWCSFDDFKVYLTGSNKEAEEPTARKWDFSNWSDATKENLKAEAANYSPETTGAASEATLWRSYEKADGGNEQNGAVYWYGTAIETGTEMTANGVVIEELKGLKFGTVSAGSLALAVNYPSTSLGTYAGPQYLWMGGKNNNFTIPAVAPGYVITMKVESHKPAEGRGVSIAINGEKIAPTVGTEKPKVLETVIWTVPETLTEAVDVVVTNNNGCHIYSIEVAEPAPATPAVGFIDPMRMGLDLEKGENDTIKTARTIKYDDFDVIVSAKAADAAETVKDNMFKNSYAGAYSLVMNSGTITIKAAYGKTIQKISIPSRTATAEKVSANVGEYTFASNVGTWTGDAAEVVLTFDGSTLTTMTVGDYVAPTIEVANIADIKKLYKDDLVKWNVSGAVVSAVAGTMAYVQDATGAIKLNGLGVTLNANKSITGAIYGKVAVDSYDNYTLVKSDASETSEVTEADAVVTPIEVDSLSKLTEANIFQLVAFNEVNLKWDADWEEGSVAQGDLTISMEDAFGLTADGYKFPSVAERVVGIIDYNYGDYVFAPISKDSIKAGVLKFVEVKNIAEVKALASGTNFKMNLEGLKVTKNAPGLGFWQPATIIVEDASGAIELSAGETGIELPEAITTQGNVVNGQLIATYAFNMMMNVNNIQPNDSTVNSTLTVDTEAKVEPTEMTIADMKKPENNKRYVKIVDVNFVLDAESYATTINDGKDTIDLFDKWQKMEYDEELNMVIHDKYEYIIGIVNQEYEATMLMPSNVSEEELAYKVKEPQAILTIAEDYKFIPSDETIAAAEWLISGSTTKSKDSTIDPATGEEATGKYYGMNIKNKGHDAKFVYAYVTGAEQVIGIGASTGGDARDITIEALEWDTVAQATTGEAITNTVTSEAYTSVMPSVKLDASKVYQICFYAYKNADPATGGDCAIYAIWFNKTATGITDVNATVNILNGDVYSINGVKVRNAGESLNGLKGLYIINGKKVVVK